MATMYETRKMAVPEIYPEHQELWEAASNGTLLIKKCNDCGEVHYYPRVFCPQCHSDNTEWQRAVGNGTVYTYSVMRVGIPYAIAFVELDEGIRLMTNIVDCDLDTIHIGQQVTVVFKATRDETNAGPFVPCFTPVEK